MEIAQAIRECHVGVVPNRKSPFTDLNFPTRLFEYLAMHRPVIAPATKGIKDYFGPDDIVFFNPGQVEDLARQILWVHAHPDEIGQIVERGREVYRRNLWSREKNRFVKRVLGVVAEKKGTRCSSRAVEKRREAEPVVTAKL
jgi:glycosyltransferase involved in cell wall biosynthesis